MTSFLKVLDNAYGQLNANISNSDLSVVLQSGEGARFPDAADNDAILTLIKWDTTTDPATISKMERVTLTTRTSDTLTITRSYGGDTAQAFDANDYVYLNLTQGVIEQIQNAINTAETTLTTDVILADGTIPLDNNVSLKGRNNADSANIEMLKVTTGDIVEFQSLPRNPSTRSIVNDYDIIDKAYFDANTTVAGVKSYTLNENLTAGDVVKIINDGGTAEIEGLLTDTLGSVSEFNATAIAQLSACQIDTDKIVICYQESNQIKAIVGTIIGTTISFGTEVTVSNSANNGEVTCAQLDTDKFVVAWRDLSNSDATVRVGSVSGTVITLGTAVDFDATAYANSVSVTQLGTDKFAIAWIQFTASDMLTIVGTVSGTTITLGSSIVLQSAATYSNTDHAIAKLDTDKYIVTWIKTNVAYFSICTVSGTVVTEEEQFGFATEATTLGKSGVERLDTDYFLFFYSESKTLHLAIGKSNGNTMEIIGDIAVQGDLASDAYVRAIGNNTFVISSSNDITGLGTVIKGYIEDDTIKIYPPITFESADDPGVTAVTKVDSTGKFVVAFDNNTSTNGEAYCITPSDFEKAAGVLQETGTTGQAKSVTIFGGIDSQRSFAAADVGKTAYIQADGSIGVTTTGFKAGRVLSTTEMTVEL